jgi:hypothetical protein
MPTDVDLHVVLPGGEEIYWGHKTSSATGAFLDLDSNAACTIDGKNNENLAVPDPPPAGQYIVRAEFYDDCGGKPANYTVTTRVCGAVQTFKGKFNAGTADHGAAGSGVEVTRFTADCPFRVRGKATYEDLAQTTKGLKDTATKLPIRFAKLEVKRASDDTTLANSDTRQDGTFDVYFKNAGMKGYYVKVLANQSNDQLKQNVKNDGTTIYSARSTGMIDETVEGNKTGVLVEAKVADSGPAFNIFDIGVDGAMFVKSMTGKAPAQLNWLWTKGKLSIGFQF